MILQRGQTGPLVTALQQRLGERGFPVALTAIYDAPTSLAVAQFQLSKGLVKDGVAGPKTLGALDLGDLQRVPVPMGDRVARARGILALGLQDDYGMGRGGTNPDAPDPYDRVDVRQADGSVMRKLELDCSGWAAYVIGLPRNHVYGAHHWIETTQLCDDANGDQVLFRRLDKAVPGCLVAYPDHDGHQGHVGLVTEVGDKLLRGIDCGQSSNGLSERDFAFFLKAGAIFVELVGDQV